MVPHRDAPFQVTFNPWQPLSKGERAQRIGAYLQFLEQRDGARDPRRKTLARREVFFQYIDGNPVTWTGAFDRGAFYDHLPEPIDPVLGEKLDLRVVWLLAAAKCNRAEQYAVDLDVRLQGEDFGVRDPYPHASFINLEEGYHTRILKDCVNVFGLEMGLRPPRAFVRWFIEAVVRAPIPLQMVAALWGELFGCVAFELLWERADLFAAQPEVMERLRLLTREILIDELGHATFVHAKLGPLQIAAMRALFPLVTAQFMQDLGEFVVLAGGRERLLERVRSFFTPEHPRPWLA